MKGNKIFQFEYKIYFLFESVTLTPQVPVQFCLFTYHIISLFFHSYFRTSYTLIIELRLETVKPFVYSFISVAFFPVEFLGSTSLYEKLDDSSLDGNGLTSSVGILLF